MTDYKQILDDLKGIAYHHPQINSFGVGDITQITMDIETKQEPRYTKMYVVPGQTVLNQNRLDYNFSIIILDRINNDYSNQQDVMSDTLEIAKDIFTILYQSYTQQYGDFSLYYEPLWGPNCTPFLERFETILGGWTLNITLEQPFDYNTCVLPISGLTLPVSVNTVNYKLILDDLNEVADKHLQINSFGYGDITQLTMDVKTKQEPKYTRMYVLPADTVLNQNQLTYNLQIIIADRLEDDYSNQKDVLNDTLEICKDIFTVLYLSEYETEWGATCEPFLERYETILCGWLLNITLTQPFDYNRCVLPELPFTEHKRWFELAELWNTINKDWEDV
jgi:hypothetical protein